MTTNTKKNHARALWTAVLACALLVSFAIPAGAVPQIMTEYGDQMPWYSADINAMGNTGAALYRGGLSNVFNPAFLSQEAGYRIDAGLALDQEHEDRFLPLFDGFESYVTDVAIASNRNHYWQTGFAVASRVSGEERGVSIGLSLADRYPFSYLFEEEVRLPDASIRDDRDAVIQDRKRDVTGNLRTLSLGAGFDASERMSFGAAVHYAFGERTEIRTVRDYLQDPTDLSLYERDEFSMDGVNFTLGMRAQVTERVDVGLAWESQLTVNGDLVKTSSDIGGGPMPTTQAEYRYPNAYRAGLAFRPRTDPRTVFTVEGEYKPWSEFMDSETPRPDEVDQLEDSMDVRVGVEHTFYNGMPLRFGFRYYDSYTDKEANASVFSAGIGAPFGAGMFSASLELSKITSVQDHQFPYPDEFLGPSYVADPQSRVEDTRFRIGVGYSLEF